MTACTHSTVIEDAHNSQPKRINATSPILSHRHTAESRVDVYYMYMKYTCYVEVSVSEWNRYNCSYQVCSI